MLCPSLASGLDMVITNMALELGRTRPDHRSKRCPAAEHPDESVLLLGDGAIISPPPPESEVERHSRSIEYWTKVRRRYRTPPPLTEPDKRRAAAAQPLGLQRAWGRTD